MTKPKRHLKGQIAELSRRTSHRRFFLRPGEDTRELVGYFFGKAALDHGQEPCVAACMSNHYHAMVFDTTADRSGFMQQFHSNVTRKRNLQLHRRESLWSSHDPGDMQILDLEAVVKRVVYIVLQPVAAGLVERVDDWTGFLIRPSDWGKPMRFGRPTHCGETMPEMIEFTPLPPPGFRDLPLADVVRFFESKIAEKEREYAALRRKNGKRKTRVIGIRACEQTNPFSSPKTPAPMRTLNPKFTGSDPFVLSQAIRALHVFREAHRSSRNAFLEGVRDIVFPSGTIQMARLAGVDCECVRDQDPHYTMPFWTEGLLAEWDRYLGLRAAA